MLMQLCFSAWYYAKQLSHTNSFKIHKASKLSTIIFRDDVTDEESWDGGVMQEVTLLSSEELRIQFKLTYRVAIP